MSSTAAATAAAHSGETGEAEAKESLPGGLHASTSSSSSGMAAGAATDGGSVFPPSGAAAATNMTTSSLRKHCNRSMSGDIDNIGSLTGLSCTSKETEGFNSDQGLSPRNYLRRSVSSSPMLNQSELSGTPSPCRQGVHDKSHEDSISKLKASVRVRRNSLKVAGENTVIAAKSVNFAPLDGTKFHEALEITLKREQEGNNKYRIVKRLKKYRGMRSDSKAENRAKKQMRRIAKRERKGLKQKAKDVIHKQHEQYALTYGMMLGVQMSVGRQFEFSTARSRDDTDTTQSSSIVESTQKISGSQAVEARKADEQSTANKRNNDLTGHHEYQKSTLRQLGSHNMNIKE